MQERYRALLLAARNLFSLTNLDDLVANILRYSRTMMQAEACSMFLPDRATKELILYSARGREDGDGPVSHAVGQGHRRLGFSRHASSRRLTMRRPIRGLMRAAERRTGFLTRAMLCAPLVDKRGLLRRAAGAEPDRAAPTFTDLDREIFEGLTSIVTGALIRFDRGAARSTRKRSFPARTVARAGDPAVLPAAGGDDPAALGNSRPLPTGAHAGRRLLSFAQPAERPAAGGTGRCERQGHSQPH